MARQRIQLRRDTASAWTAANPVLLAGEVGYETNTGLLKVGNGATPWNSLGYFNGGGGGGGATALTQLADVDALAAVDGSVLTYDEVSAKFTASPANTKLTIADGGNF